MKSGRVPKILMFGHGGMHVARLASALKAHQVGRISVLEISTPVKRSLTGETDTVFDAVYPLNARDASIPADLAGLCCQSPSWESFRSFVTITTKLLFFGITAPRKLRGIGQEIHYLRTFHRIERDFDILHLHFMSPRMAEFVRILPESRKLLVSIWGSDLLRVAGASNYRSQLQICQRASIITVRSTELREILLAKFGRDLASKVRIAKFGSPLIPIIRKSDVASLRREFRDEFQLKDDQLLVCLGHNGFRENQHVQMLTALERLSDGLKQRLVFVAPMAYGTDSVYSKLCENVAKEKHLQLHVLREFLSQENTVRLRAGTDVMIHLPISDALSGAMGETIFAGNVVVTGTWLPYGEIRRRGIHFREISSLTELPSVLESLAANIEQEKAIVRATSERIREVIGWDEIIRAWTGIFAELTSVRHPMSDGDS